MNYLDVIYGMPHAKTASTPFIVLNLVVMRNICHQSIFFLGKLYLIN